MVGQAVQEQLTLNPERAIRWVAEASPVVTVLADAHRIQQVVANLAGNALKFSRANQAVDVQVQTKGGEAHVSVHDEGIAIPLAEQPHIWEQFYQVAGAGVQSGLQVGIGISLYVSKAIVEGHKGQVGIESAPSQGTTIWFTLPVASSPTPSSSEAGADSSVSLPQPSEHERIRDCQDL